MHQVRIVLADDHVLVRAGIRSILETLPQVCVIAEASDGLEALQLIEQHRPDIALLDIGMPKLNGIELTARVVKAAPEVKVVILTGLANEEYVIQALRAGATGFVVKDATVSELKHGLESIMAGRRYLSAAISQQVIQGYIDRVSGTGSPLDLLSSRQRELLQLIAEGHSTKEIAHLLKVSPKTVETHRAQLMQRLHIYDLAGLVRYAVRTGLVQEQRLSPS